MAGSPTIGIGSKQSINCSAAVSSEVSGAAEKKTNELEQTRNKMIRLVTALSEIAKSTADITRIEYAKFYIAKDEPTRHIQDNHGISEYGKKFSPLFLNHTSYLSRRHRLLHLD